MVMTSYALMELLFSPTLGNRSDGFGRRPVLFGSFMVVTFDSLMMALASGMRLFLSRQCRHNPLNAHEKRVRNFGEA